MGHVALRENLTPGRRIADRCAERAHAQSELIVGSLVPHQRTGERLAESLLLFCRELLRFVTHDGRRFGLRVMLPRSSQGEARVVFPPSRHYDLRVCIAERPRSIRSPRIVFLALLSSTLLAIPQAVSAAEEPADAPPQEVAASREATSPEATSPGPAGDPAVPDSGIAAPDPDVASPASNAVPPDKPYWRRNLFGRFFSDQKFLFTDWIHSEARRPGFMVPVLVGTSLAVAGSRDADASQPDVTFERDFSSDTSGGGRQTAHMFTTLGDAPVGLLLIGTAYLTGRWSGHDQFAESASLSAEAVLNTGLWVTVLKGLTGRTRPNASGTGQFLQYQPVQGQTVGSFPSGHTAGAFAAASVFAGMYREQHPWVPWVAYGTATLVGASRVALGRHFPTDVLVGACIGDSFGRMALERNRRDKKVETASFGFSPYYDPASRAGGVAWSMHW